MKIGELITIDHGSYTETRPLTKQDVALVNNYHNVEKATKKNIDALIDEVDDSLDFIIDIKNLSNTHMPEHLLPNYYDDLGFITQLGHMKLASFKSHTVTNSKLFYFWEILRKRPSFLSNEIWFVEGVTELYNAGIITDKDMDGIL